MASSVPNQDHLRSRRCRPGRLCNDENRLNILLKGHLRRRIGFSCNHRLFGSQCRCRCGCRVMLFSLWAWFVRSLKLGHRECRQVCQCSSRRCHH